VLVVRIPGRCITSDTIARANARETPARTRRLLAQRDFAHLSDGLDDDQERRGDACFLERSSLAQRSARLLAAELED
jgi:hypothetical protein